MPSRAAPRAPWSRPLVLAVGEEVDLFTSAQLKSAVDDIVARRPDTVIVDLSEATFVASVGVQILALMGEGSVLEDGSAVVTDGPTTRWLIQLTKLDEVIALYPTLPDAPASLELSGPGTGG